jgi:hypothetical protein
MVLCAGFSLTRNIVAGLNRIRYCISSDLHRVFRAIPLAVTGATCNAAEMSNGRLASAIRRFPKLGD